MYTVYISLQNNSATKRLFSGLKLLFPESRRNFWGESLLAQEKQTLKKTCSMFGGVAEQATEKKCGMCFLIAMNILFHQAATKELRCASVSFTIHTNDVQLDRFLETWRRRSDRWFNECPMPCCFFLVFSKGSHSTETRTAILSLLLWWLEERSSKNSVRRKHDSSLQKAKQHPKTTLPNFGVSKHMQHAQKVIHRTKSLAPARHTVGGNLPNTLRCVTPSYFVS